MEQTHTHQPAEPRVLTIKGPNSEGHCFMVARDYQEPGVFRVEILTRTGHILQYLPRFDTAAQAREYLCRFF
jgi:hypothetical protein